MIRLSPLILLAVAVVSEDDYKCPGIKDNDWTACQEVETCWGFQYEEAPGSGPISQCYKLVDGRAGPPVFNNSATTYECFELLDNIGDIAALEGKDEQFALSCGGRSRVRWLNLDVHHGFAITVLAITVVPMMIITGLFYKRRTIQPIKARGPGLVALCDCSFIVWIVLLCSQRLASSEFPCVITLFMSYMGAIVVLNIFLVRCATLYLHFNNTNKILEAARTLGRMALSMDTIPRASQSTKMHEIDKEAKQEAAQKTATNDLTKRLLKSNTLLWGACGASVLLLLPPIIITADSAELRAHVGDGCLEQWNGGASILGFFACVYMAIFMGFAYFLRGLADGFKIKKELALTAMCGLVCVVPWFYFSNVLAGMDANDSFPFSTLFLILAAVWIFSVGTIWPLYMSYQDGTGAKLDIIPPKTLKTIGGTLSIPEGYESFKQFLISEFSVENLLFWKAVSGYQEYCAEEMEAPQPFATTETHICAKALEINNFYIVLDGPLAVNLPAVIMENLAAQLKVLHIVDSDAADGTDESGLDIFNTDHLTEVDVHVEMHDAANEEPEKKEQRISRGRSIRKSIWGRKKEKRESTPDATTTPLIAETVQEEISEEKKTRLETITKLFDEAQRSIFKLMERDSFARYTRTEPYKQLVQKLTDEHGKMKALEMGGVV